MCEVTRQSWSVMDWKKAEGVFQLPDWWRLLLHWWREAGAKLKLHLDFNISCYRTPSPSAGQIVQRQVKWTPCFPLCVFQGQQPISNSSFRHKASSPCRLSRLTEKATNSPLRLHRLQQSVHQELSPQSTPQDAHRWGLFTQWQLHLHPFF